jgi:hypothetical protein
MSEVVALALAVVDLIEARALDPADFQCRSRRTRV